MTVELQLRTVLVIGRFHIMNYLNDETRHNIPERQIAQFQQLIAKLYQCCQDRMRYQTERFKRTKSRNPARSVNYLHMRTCK